jgi:hypothetical protein
MAPRLRWFVFVPLAVGLLAVPTPPGAEACAVAPARNVVVEVASESAIIVWDAASRTQHFIRRAAFNATAPGDAKVQDFGFLVPTPTPPVLTEVDDKAFDELAKVTAPKTETQKRPSGGCAIGCAAAKTPGAAGKVEVLEEKHVAGYDARVLKATDADALAAWLKDHEYESRPALTRWLKPYVDRGWIVTAFKIARSSDTPAGFAIGSSAVRMSFTTDAPFFPYSEPDDMREAKTRRLLRVFFLGAKKMQGARGDAEWAGKIAWAGPLPADSAKALAPLLKIPDYPPSETTWLTEFEDDSSPRPGDRDVTFTVNPNQDPVARPTRIVYAARADNAGRAGFVIFAAGILGIYLIQRFRFAPKLSRGS